MPEAVPAITAHAERNLFTLEAWERGFRAIIPYAPDLEVGAPFVLEAWREAPELRGTVVRWDDTRTEEGHYSYVDVACDPSYALYMHLAKAQKANPTDQDLHA